MKNYFLRLVAVCFMLTLNGCGDAEDIPDGYTRKIDVVELRGDWKVNEGKAKIIVDSNPSRIKLITETGLEGNGSIDEGKILVPDWNVTGRLLADKSAIIWSNGATWSR